MKVYFEDDIAEFKLGAVVKTKAGTANLVGHVVGFKLNNVDEVIVAVALCTGETKSLHTSNLMVLV